MSRAAMGQAVCVCPRSEGGYNSVLNFRIVLVVHGDLAGREHAGSGLGSSAPGGGGNYVIRIIPHNFAYFSQIFAL